VPRRRPCSAGRPMAIASPAISILPRRRSDAPSMLTQDIPYRDGAASLRGFLACDETARDRRPGVLVVHEGLALATLAALPQVDAGRLGAHASALVARSCSNWRAMARTQGRRELPWRAHDQSACRGRQDEGRRAGLHRRRRSAGAGTGR
jgi:hypothetical protein